MFASSRSFDRGIQCQQVGLLRNSGNNFQDPANMLTLGIDLLNDGFTMLEIIKQ